MILPSILNTKIKPLVVLKEIKGGFPVMAEITPILAANIHRQFFLLSELQ